MIGLSPGDQLDIQWYVHEAGAALGERSPLGAQLDAARLRLGTMRDGRGPDMDRAAAVIRRYDMIRGRLHSMTRRSRAVLLAAYTGHVSGLESYSRLGPVLLMCESSRAAYRRAEAKRGNHITRLCAAQLAKWLSKRLRSDERLKSEALSEAEKLLGRACVEYVSACRRSHVQRLTT